MAFDPATHRGKLREFSLQLAERLKAAPARAAQPMRLAVHIGSAAYLLPMEMAGEIVPVPAIAPVPWTQPWFRGLANVRGRLIGVVDLMHFAGRGALAPQQALQLLVLGDALKLNTGILVTRAFGLRNLNELEPQDAGGEPLAAWEVGRWRDLNGAVLTELDLPQLVSSDRFAAIGA
jgi:twitching motility protein PilI